MAQAKLMADEQRVAPDVLMRRYKETGDLELRNQLVLHYAPQINAAIYSMRSILLSHIPFEDFFNQGVLTLIDCIEKYNPDWGASFDTYIYKAVRGAMLNYMRKQNWLPNRVRDARKNLVQRRGELRQSLMREPSNRELAAAMGISEQKLSQYEVEIAAVEAVSLEEMLEQAYETALDRSQSLQEDSVEGSLLDVELRQILADTIDALPPKQKQIITLCYFENLNLREIGEVMNLTQQRVSQIRTAALERLNKTLKQYMNNS